MVDVDPETFNLTASAVENAITPKTKAIVPVHLYGQSCDMESIVVLAEKYNLYVIEDNAQAIGADYTFSDGRKAKTGTIGHIGSTSFFPSKNLGCYGDGGALMTNDDKLAQKMRMIANHGQEGKHNHLIEGRNSRLDGIQAAILRAKLPYLKAWTDKRIEISKIYKSKLDDLNAIQTPIVNPEAKHVFHLFVIKAKERNDLMEFLAKNSIDTAIHYPVSLPFLECYKKLNYSYNQFPNSYKLQNEILSLPMYPELEANEIDAISDVIIEFYNR
jgi:dTDP-4-amino-4,6-dideoxygalactose transaminase